jgi:hypothetical protein
MSGIQIGDIVALTSDRLFPEGRREGVVTAVGEDGKVTAEFPQDGLPPLVAAIDGHYFEHVRTAKADMFRTLLLKEYGGMDGFLKANGITPDGGGA